MLSPDEVLNHLRGLRRPLILGHRHADPDSVASAYALARLLDTSFGFPEGVSREGATLLKYLDTPFEINPSVEGKDVVVVDTSSAEMLRPLSLERAASVTVIDHHSQPPSIKGTLFVFPEFSSTSEIVYHVLNAAGALDELVSTALAAGILFDTKGLSLARGDTLRVVANLLGRKSVRDVLSIFSGTVDVTERIARLKALRKGEIIRVGDFILTMSETGAFEASVATVLIQAGADVAVAFSDERVSVRLSEAALSRGIDAARILYEIDPEHCGGHSGAAGCSEVDGKSLANQIVSKVLEMLKEDVRRFGVRRY